jgi:hypothetical protein
METFLFTTAFKRPNGEILPGDVLRLDDGAFKFNANDFTDYSFTIKKDGSSKWIWVSGHSASIERVLDLGEKIDSFLAIYPV